MRKRRGVALADFLAGTMILAGVMSVFVAMTKSKFDVLLTGELRLRGLTAASAGIDDVRVGGLAARPSGEADGLGFQAVEAPTKLARIPSGELAVEARPLRVDGGASHDLYEVRVTASWQLPGESRDRVSLSTVATLPPAGGGQ